MPRMTAGKSENKKRGGPKKTLSSPRTTVGGGGERLGKLVPKGPSHQRRSSIGKKPPADRAGGEEKKCKWQTEKLGTRCRSYGIGSGRPSRHTRGVEPKNELATQRKGKKGGGGGGQGEHLFLREAMELPPTSRRQGKMRKATGTKKEREETTPGIKTTPRPSKKTQGTVGLGHLPARPVLRGVKDNN